MEIVEVINIYYFLTGWVILGIFPAFLYFLKIKRENKTKNIKFYLTLFTIILLGGFSFFVLIFGFYLSISNRSSFGEIYNENNRE